MTLYCHVSLPDAERTTLLDALQPDETCLLAQDLPKADRQAHARRADVIWGNVPTDWLTGHSTLRWLQLNSAGLNPYNRLDWSALPDVTVTNLRDFFGQPCAETMLAGILALYRGIVPLVHHQRDRTWAGNEVRPALQLLAGKRALVLGAGSIGEATGRLLEAFSCAVTYIRRSQPPTLAELDSLLPEADLVVMTLPETPDTHHLLHAGNLSLLKPGSVVANIGRGSAIDEGALVEALTNGPLGGAVLDVTAVEPLPTDSPLWQMPNVLLTQHTGGGYAGEKTDQLRFFLDNLRRFRAGEPLLNRVDFGRGY